MTKESAIDQEEKTEATEVEKAEKPEVDSTEKQVAELLPVQLTDHEMGVMGKEVGRLSLEKYMIEGSFERTKKEFKGKIEAIEEDIQELFAFLREGIEHRKVDCTIYYDFEGNVKRLIRLDTGEQIWEKAISLDERQMLIDTKDNKEGDGSDLEFRLLNLEPAKGVTVIVDVLNEEDGFYWDVSMDAAGFMIGKKATKSLPEKDQALIGGLVFLKGAIEEAVKKNKPKSSQKEKVKKALESVVQAIEERLRVGDGEAAH